MAALIVYRFSLPASTHCPVDAMRYTTKHQGTTNNIQPPKDPPSMIGFAFQLMWGFVPLYAGVTMAAMVAVGAKWGTHLLPEVLVATLNLWWLPIVSWLRYSIIKPNCYVVVNEIERKIYQYITTNQEVIPSADLHAWLQRMWITGRSGEKDFRAMGHLPSGRAASDEYRRELKGILVKAELWEDKGGRLGGWPKGGPEAVAALLELPPLSEDSNTPNYARAGRQSTARQSVMSPNGHYG